MHPENFHRISSRKSSRHLSRNRFGLFSFFFLSRNFYHVSITTLSDSALGFFYWICPVILLNMFSGKLYGIAPEICFESPSRFYSTDPSLWRLQCLWEYRKRLNQKKLVVFFLILEEATYPPNTTKHDNKKNLCLLPDKVMCVVLFTFFDIFFA